MSFAVRRAQPELFPVVSPLTGRFGADFFRQLPVSPGVYFFHGEDDKLLYIGQSHCLRKRIGSYRFVSDVRHPRRTVRLLQRVVRITWQLCDSPVAAIALEAELLLTHRPPFNRAGVWQHPPWWMQAMVLDGELLLQLSADPGGSGEWLGPLPGNFRYPFAVLVRLVYALTTNRFHPWELPSGMNRPILPPVHGWPAAADSPALMEAVRELILTGNPALVLQAQERLAGLAAGALTTAFWEEQFGCLTRFSNKWQAAVQASSGLASPDLPPPVI